MDLRDILNMLMKKSFRSCYRGANVLSLVLYQQIKDALRKCTQLDRSAVADISPSKPVHNQ
jgi:hypothetical protein